MTLYLCVIVAGMLTIAFTVSTALGVAFWGVLGNTALCTALVIAVDGLTATVARLLPKRFANHESRVFLVNASEKRFYEKIGIRKWKDKIPELGHFTGFRKNKIENPKDGAYLQRFLMEICYGEIGHFYSCFTGFATLFVCFWVKNWMWIAVFVSVVNAVLNVLPLFVLRYNSYKLRILWKQTQKRRETC